MVKIDQRRLQPNQEVNPGAHTVEGIAFWDEDEAGDVKHMRVQFSHIISLYH